LIVAGEQRYTQQMQDRNIFNQHPNRPSESLTLGRNSQHDKTKPKQRSILLLACHPDRKLPPLANDNYGSQHCFRNVNKRFPPNTMLI
jgi:hypothetical protein